MHSVLNFHQGGQMVPLNIRSMVGLDAAAVRRGEVLHPATLGETTGVFGSEWSGLLISAP